MKFTPIIERMKPKPRAAGAVVFRRTNGGVKLLVLRAYKNWDFPKGTVDPGEDQLHAAKREIAEETGLTELEYPFGDEHKETLPYAGNKIARYYIAETDTEAVSLPINPVMRRPEHDEWRWVSLEAARALAPARLQGVVDWAAGILAG